MALRGEHPGGCFLVSSSFYRGLAASLWIVAAWPAEVLLVLMEVFALPPFRKGRERMGHPRLRGAAQEKQILRAAQDDKPYGSA